MMTISTNIENESFFVAITLTMTLWCWYSKLNLYIVMACCCTMDEVNRFKSYQSETENLSFYCYDVDLEPMTLILKLDLYVVVTY